MNFIALVALGAYLGFIVGIALGDTATLRDCASAGQATLVGGATVKCEVNKNGPV